MAWLLLYKKRQSLNKLKGQIIQSIIGRRKIHLSQKERDSRDGRRGRGEERNIKEEFRCAMRMYQLCTRNVNIMGCKRVLIKNKNRR